MFTIPPGHLTGIKLWVKTSTSDGRHAKLTCWLNTNLDEWALANMPFTHTAVYQA